MTDRATDYAGLLSEYLPRRRWFPAKGRAFSIGSISTLPWFEPADGGGGRHSRLEMVNVAFADGSTETYQVPVAYLDEADPSLEHALIGHVDDPELGPVVAYDGVYVKETSAALLDGFRGGGTARGAADEGVLQFQVVEGTELPAESPPGAVMSAEQSNTSIVYGDDAILKLFRRVSHGDNPDIEIHAALTRAGFENVAPLLGWLHGRWAGPDGEPQEGDLGMLQAFLRTATDGWGLALASVRDLLDEEDLHPGEVGGDFAGESERLGEVVAAVHAELARHFPTGAADAVGREELAEAMQARLSAAVDVVPALAELERGLRARLDRIRASSTSIPTQRIHGDLHLGQTLRTVKGWKIIDFEGEPAKSLAERTSLSSALRDVAGMLRSFDYAAGVTLQGFGTSPGLAYRADEWTQRNRAAFLRGYASVAGDEPAADPDLLAAFEADKAIYEAVYEARNRPTWVGIPLRAIARIAAEE